MKKGKYGVIDIGSNSARLMLIQNGEAIYKKIEITKLAKSLVNDVLREEAIERCAKIVDSFYKEAINDGAEEVFAFGTATLRRASNSDVFQKRVKELCGLSVEIVSGEEEAYLGASGAIQSGNGGVIDVGGASTEIVVLKNGEPIYAKSLNIGAVVLFGIFGDDEQALNEYLEEKVLEYGNVPKTEFYGIGGTATSVASILQKLEPYDPKKVDGYKVTRKEIYKLTDRLFAMPVQEKERLKGLHPGRAEIIASGVAILAQIMKHYSIDAITVSEKDNLEGYFNKVMK